MQNNEFVDKYKNLVYDIAHKYSRGNDIEDLFQVGMCGLLKALDNFDDSYNVKFSTYACIWVSGEIIKYVKGNNAVKINPELLKISSAITKAREKLIQIYMRKPTLAELSLYLGIDRNLIIEADASRDAVMSLDQRENDEGKELNLYDMVSYNERGYDEDILDLRIELENLHPIEAQIIRSRYFEDKTQSEVSRELGMSQVQVSRKENKILQKLRDKIAS